MTGKRQTASYKADEKTLQFLDKVVAYYDGKLPMKSKSRFVEMLIKNFGYQVLNDHNTFLKGKNNIKKRLNEDGFDENTFKVIEKDVEYKIVDFEDELKKRNDAINEQNEQLRKLLSAVESKKAEVDKYQQEIDELKRIKNGLSSQLGNEKVELRSENRRDKQVNQEEVKVNKRKYVYPKVSSIKLMHNDEVIKILDNNEMLVIADEIDFNYENTEDGLIELNSRTCRLIKSYLSDNPRMSYRLNLSIKDFEEVSEQNIKVDNSGLKITKIPVDFDELKEKMIARNALYPNGISYNLVGITEEGDEMETERFYKGMIYDENDINEELVKNVMESVAKEVGKSYEEVKEDIDAEKTLDEFKKNLPEGLIPDVYIDF